LHFFFRAFDNLLPDVADEAKDNGRKENLPDIPDIQPALPLATLQRLRPPIR
jgi:hypothetical protein